jgi:hypothetical protein
LLALCGASPLKSACNPDGSPSAASFAEHGEAPSDEEAIALAKSLERRVKAGDVSGAGALFSWETVIDFATDGVPAPAKFQINFKAGAIDGLKSRNSLVTALAKSSAAGGSYKFLHLHEKDGQKRVCFRVLTNTGGLNYHDMILLKYKDGQVRVADLYIAALGEFFSQTFRSLYLSSAAAASENSLDRENEHDRDLTKSAIKLKEMSDKARSGKPTEALDIYKSLPETIKGDKSVLLLRLKAANALKVTDKDKAYNALIEDFRRYHPGDPCLELINIDHYITAKQYDEVLATIDRLEKFVDGDPYLDVFRANAYIAEKKFDKALEAARRATDVEKDLKAGYRAQLIGSTSLKDYKEASRIVAIMEHDLKIDTTGILKQPLYRAFLASPEYNALKRNALGKGNDSPPADGDTGP